MVEIDQISFRVPQDAAPLKVGMDETSLIMITYLSASHKTRPH